VAEHPAGDPGRAQQPDQQPLRGRVRSIRRGRDQLPGRGRAVTAQVAAVRPVQRREPDVPLQGAVQEHRAVPKCHRGLQRGQRRVREPEIADADQVREAEVAAAEPGSALRSAGGTPRDRQVDDGRGPLEHPVPVRRSRPGHRRRLATRPQPGRPHPGLVAQPVPADQEHPREQALPVPVAHPAVHGGRGQAAAARLGEREHAGLPGEQLGQRHQLSIAPSPLAPRPNGETPTRDRRLWSGRRVYGPPGPHMPILPTERAGGGRPPRVPVHKISECGTGSPHTGLWDHNR
jgi:hypothetical protein